jgi:hypothetical protein
MLYSPPLVAELARQFEIDLQDATQLEAPVFAKRPYLSRLTENACRLFSPLL